MDDPRRAEDRGRREEDARDLTKMSYGSMAHQCKECRRETYAKVVRVTLWSGDRLIVVENVTARICDDCQEQYYDDDTSEKILQLASTSFPPDKVVREITASVFSLDDKQK